MAKTWNDITLFKYQQIDAINERDISELDKVLFNTCVVYDLTEYQLDNASKRNASRMIGGMKRLFESEFKKITPAKIGKWIVDYDPSLLRFGQYIELMYFLQQKPVQVGQYVLASITHQRGKANDSAQHRAKAEQFLNTPVAVVIGAVAAFIENFRSFNKEYVALFGLNEEVVGTQASVDKFNKRYGWQYSATAIAEYERITLTEAYNLPVRNALNDLVYLKAKNEYDAKQLKQSRNAR